MKTIRIFYLKICQFLVVKFSIYLNRRVFVMLSLGERRIQLMTELCLIAITKTRLNKYIENFTMKNRKFSDKNSDIFHISAQNMDSGYSLEPPHRGSSNEYP